MPFSLQVFTLAEIRKKKRLIITKSNKLSSKRTNFTNQTLIPKVAFHSSYSNIKSPSVLKICYKCTARIILYDKRKRCSQLTNFLTLFLNRQRSRTSILNILSERFQLNMLLELTLELPLWFRTSSTLCSC